MPIATDRAIFVDTNVLVRANILTAPLHEQALALFAYLWGAKTEIWISRQVLREYLAVVTRPQTFMIAISPEKAIERGRFFKTHFQVADETAAVTENLFMLVKTIALGGKQVHDANIIATMQAYQIDQLLTYNPHDFQRFQKLVTVIDAQTLARELRL
jgi:predicted nucleic acid-binding protein